ncbi:hypothetical protein [Leptolyngbya sp. 'hensonii']|uniref:hypothetical protein n=1 Tax=Leptolyngbya sp. 'hensonii' TaxID=1922337 RepID=UPI000B091C18|nr:hypothetical protein [Leptolyngbya sp. 'hensonii']
MTSSISSLNEEETSSKEYRDKFDVLSALWVLACNNPISIMSYNGIRYRLKLPADADIESLVEERGELFRPGVPPRRLEEWKIAMRSQVRGLQLNNIPIN